MASIIDTFGLRKTNGDIGIEIEIEGRNLPIFDWGDVWKTAHDGSLKPKHEAMEYVLSSPVGIDEVPAALKLLEKAFKKNKAVVDDTYRAGIHVHVNVQDLTMVQLINMICLFIILEDYYLDFCAPSRRGNHFCLRTYDAGYFLDCVSRMCEEENTGYIHTDDLRYSAINLQSLFRYGSVEFRSLESTQDHDKIYTWCKMLMCLKEGAKKYNNPKDIMYALSFEGYDWFMKELLGDFFPSLKKMDNWELRVRQGILRAQDIAFSRDWDRVNLNIFKKNGGMFE